jgi:RNA polymerase sigma factor (sigma-70 family)
LEEIDLKSLRDELLRGNNQSLKEVFEKYGSYCIKLLQKNTGCAKEDAEDIFMDAVLIFRRNIVTGRIEYLTSVKSYLFTTASNMWLARFKKEKITRERSGDIFAHLYDSSVSEVEHEILERISSKAMQSLGEKCQMILTLFYLEELSMKDIAQRLGLANAEVSKTMKSRCLKKLIDEASRLLKVEGVGNGV